MEDIKISQKYIYSLNEMMEGADRGAYIKQCRKKPKGLGKE